MLRQILLSIAGYKVLTATNPQSAMQLFTLNKSTWSSQTNYFQGVPGRSLLPR